VVVVGHSLGAFTAPLVCTRLRVDLLVLVLAAEARRRSRDEASKALREPWPLDAWPDVPTRYLLCRGDRMFTAAWARRHARERLGIEADEMAGGHYVTLSRPRELAARLDAYADAVS
jgi:pimeloyl-ACP methyl ester carboxylesterase